MVGNKFSDSQQGLQPVIKCSVNELPLHIRFESFDQFYKRTCKDTRNAKPIVRLKSLVMRQSFVKGLYRYTSARNVQNMKPPHLAQVTDILTPDVGRSRLLKWVCPFERTDE